MIFFQVAEFVVIDEGVTFDASHPMHIHGYSFRVVALEKLNKSTSVEEVMALDRAGIVLIRHQGVHQVHALSMMCH